MRNLIEVIVTETMNIVKDAVVAEQNQNDVENHADRILNRDEEYRKIDAAIVDRIKADRDSKSQVHS